MTLAHPAFAPLDAPTLVEASAGTGKTYTITTYFVRGIVEHGHNPKEILVVTYTRAATSELRARVRERIAEALARWFPGMEPIPEAAYELRGNDEPGGDLARQCKLHLQRNEPLLSAVVEIALEGPACLVLQGNDPASGLPELSAAIME